MKRFLKILAVILFIAYFVASIVLWSNKGDELVCNNFYINVCDSAECDLITAEKLYNHLRKEHLLPQGKACRDINLTLIEESVSRIDLLTNINCYYEQNGDVYLQVEPTTSTVRAIA